MGETISVEKRLNCWQARGIRSLRNKLAVKSIDRSGVAVLLGLQDHSETLLALRRIQGLVEIGEVEVMGDGFVSVNRPGLEHL